METGQSSNLKVHTYTFIYMVEQKVPRPTNMGKHVFLHREEKPEYYEKFKPLNEDDVQDIKTEIEKLLKEEKFSDSEWGLS